MKYSPFRRPSLPCDQRKDAKPRCWCRHCEANRDRANAAQQARIHQHRDRPRPVQNCRCQHCADKRIAARERRYGVGRALTWRCDCGAIPTGPECHRCKRVPDWAVPEVA